MDFPLVRWSPAGMRLDSHFSEKILLFIRANCMAGRGATVTAFLRLGGFRALPDADAVGFYRFSGPSSRGNNRQNLQSPSLHSRCP